MTTEDVRDRVVSYVRHNAGKPPEALAEMVRESQGRLLTLLSGVPETLASRPPSEGEWSLRELVRHVVKSESSVTQLVLTLSAGRQPEQRGGIGAMIEDDGRPWPALLDELAATNAQMLSAIRSLSASDDLSAVASHPWFGALNCREWAVFQRVHDADHVGHSQKILAALESQPQA